ncbi:hypothetical protein JMUB6875_17830 [Nocardia sp. JMUB6875]
MNPLNSVAAQPRRPQVAAEIPIRAGEIVIGETPSGFEDPDPVALFGQPQRGDAAAESRPDDHDIVVGLARAHGPPPNSDGNSVIRGPVRFADVFVADPRRGDAALETAPEK